jgi:hypothetical protein
VTGEDESALHRFDPETLAKRLRLTLYQGGDQELREMASWHEAWERVAWSPAPTKRVPQAGEVSTARNTYRGACQILASSPGPRTS